MNLAHELHDLVQTLDRHAEKLLRPQGLSYARYVALVIVAEHPGVTGRILAGALGSSEAATGKLVRRLLDDGLIRDDSPEQSGHVRHLVVTDAGAAKLATCTELLGDALDRNARLIGVDPQELATTIRALHDEVRRAPGAADQENR